MEELNKNQLVLLTLLVSFVTSIATGIITVALLQEAPPSVTQVVNRVVERTIEQVVTAPGATSTPTRGEGVREVRTVVVSEEDQVVSAVNKNSKALIRITDNALVDGKPTFYGLGFFITRDGLAVSGKRDIANLSTTYTGIMPDGSSYQLKLVGVDEMRNLAFFRVARDPRQAFSVEPVAIGVAVPQLGQSVVTFDGEGNTRALTGRIAALDMAPDGKEPVRISTDIRDTATTLGAPLANLSGEVIGIRAEAPEGGQIFVPALALRLAISQYPPQR
jgi:hypothetical protein